MSEPVAPSRIGIRKCSDIPDVEFLAAVDKCCDLRGPTFSGHPVTMATRWDVAAVLAGHPEDVGEGPRDYPGVPEKVVMAKARRLDRRGLISGCDCGCRGDFEITPKGRRLILEARSVERATTEPVPVYVSGLADVLSRHPDGDQVAAVVSAVLARAAAAQLAGLATRPAKASPARFSQGCRRVGGTWLHGRPHSCPKWVRG